MEHDDFQAQLDALAAQMREGAEGLIREATVNIEMYDRLRWHMAAECAHAVAIMRVIDHRQSVMQALVERLAPQQLPPPQEEQPPPLPEEDGPSALREVLKRMRDEEARREARGAVPTGPQPHDVQGGWGHAQPDPRRVYAGGR